MIKLKYKTQDIYLQEFNTNDQKFLKEYLEDYIKDAEDNEEYNLLDSEFFENYCLFYNGFTKWGHVVHYIIFKELNDETIGGINKLNNVHNDFMGIFYRGTQMEFKCFREIKG